MDSYLEKKRTFNELWIQGQRHLQAILSEEHQLAHARPEKVNSQ